MPEKSPLSSAALWSGFLERLGATGFVAQIRRKPIRFTVFSGLIAGPIASRQWDLGEACGQQLISPPQSGRAVFVTSG
jgi:hypothetical protein